MGVQTSPNAGSITERSVTLQSAAAGTGNGTRIALSPGDQVRVTTVGASVPNAIVTYEWSDDSFVTTYAAAMEDIQTAAGIATRILTTTVSTTKAQLAWTAPPGATGFQARVSTFVAGTITCTAVVRSRS